MWRGRPARETYPHQFLPAIYPTLLWRGIGQAVPAPCCTSYDQLFAGEAPAPRWLVQIKLLLMQARVRLHDNRLLQ